ncbi:hypothetical protein GTP45_12705 [Pseudoduganella sp. FT55W]|uniref:Uncharacterized protein n=1 Tax=Duganella rivi TaxID=2666083 RepID=A0A7X4KBW0_9BURK|nr:hypothetical protein [Duganella rivi]MYM67689.1 hypothetical protein [Duganella rivi]
MGLMLTAAALPLVKDSTKNLHKLNADTTFSQRFIYMADAKRMHAGRARVPILYSACTLSVICMFPICTRRVHQAAPSCNRFVHLAGRR